MPVKKQRKRNRLQNFDYACNGLYFVTICTHRRVHFFGGIHHDTMCVNKLGSIIYRQWIWLQKQYPYIKTHAFIVMPNHVHGIIEINSNMIHTSDESPTSVGTGRDLSLPRTMPKIKPLPEIIGAFKTTSSKIIHQHGLRYFSWQRSFHDHIIRNKSEYNQIYKYVHMNPVLWYRDRNNIA